MQNSAGTRRLRLIYVGFLARGCATRRGIDVIGDNPPESRASKRGFNERSALARVAVRIPSHLCSQSVKEEREKERGRESPLALDESSSSRVVCFDSRSSILKEPP